MKFAYPVVLTPVDAGFVVYVPDMQINTEGKDLADALYMAGDAISSCAIALQDMRKPIPEPSDTLPPCAEGDITTFVLVDFDAYRRAADLRTVRKNVTLPSYLNEAAEKSGINFSRVLQDGLKRELGIM